MRETAPWGRRFVALIVDWVACTIITVLVLGPHGWSSDPASSWITLGLFWAESSLGIGLVGGSFGQLATRLRVLRTDGAPLPLLPAVARQLLVCLVIPPLVFKPDGRGLHDLAAGTATFPLVASVG